MPDFWLLIVGSVPMVVGLLVTGYVWIKEIGK